MAPTPYLWSDKVVDFVNQLIRAYPGIHNKEIAQRLSEKYGKNYSKNAVTGKLWRDRRKAAR